MYRLQRALERILASRATGDELFPAAAVAGLGALAATYRQTVTLYYDRNGMGLQATQGDDRLAERHLRHRTTNRLSTVRALRVVVPDAPLPRGRDSREAGELALDCMALVTVEGQAVLLVPRVVDGEPDGTLDERSLASPSDLSTLRLDDVVAPVTAELGRLRPAMAPSRQGRTALLVGVEFTAAAHRHRSGASLDELARLATTAGLRPAGRLQQRLVAPRPGTFLGRGKLDELRALVLDEGMEVVLMACDLPYTTASRLASTVGVPLLDRSELILEIFARHATTNEGRLQVQLARLDHELHRLVKEEKDLDRQAGGIGIRGGPGETAATLAKRRIHRKRVRLERRLDVLRERRRAGRRRRQASALPRVSLAGYTNAGKSTLLNALVGRVAVEARDQLFTTLTTTTRRLSLPTGRPSLWSDTVGFIENLPHHLVAAFETTLQEAADADLTVVLIEASVATIERHRRVVAEVLDRLGSDPRRRLPVLSKVDLLTPADRDELRRSFPGALEVSAVTGEGLSALLEAVEALVAREDVEVELLVPYERMALVDELMAAGVVLRHRWTEGGAHLRVLVAAASGADLSPYVVR